MARPELQSCDFPARAPVLTRLGYPLLGPGRVGGSRWTRLVWLQLKYYYMNFREAGKPP